MRKLCKILALIYNGVSLAFVLFFTWRMRGAFATEASVLTVLYSAVILCIVQPSTWLKLVVVLMCALNFWQLSKMFALVTLGDLFVDLWLSLGPLITLVAVFWESLNSDTGEARLKACGKVLTYLAAGCVTLTLLYITAVYINDKVSSKRDFQAALALALEGDAKAQGRLAGYFSGGWGVAEDQVEAVKWYRKGAEQGNASAQYNLAAAYEHGTGVAMDEAESIKWYRLAYRNDGPHSSLPVSMSRLGTVAWEQEHPKEPGLFESPAPSKGSGSPAAKTASADTRPAPGYDYNAWRKQYKSTITQPEVDTAPAPPAPPEWVAPAPVVRAPQEVPTLRHLDTDARATTGDVLINRLQGLGGKGTLTVVNQAVSDVYVKIIAGGRLAVSFYVRGGETFAFKGLTDGTYGIMYCGGFGWDATRGDFSRGRTAQRYNTPLTYTLETKRESGQDVIYSTVFTLTLSPGRDDQGTSSSIPLEEFDRF